MKTIIHINRNVIQQNAKRDTKLPVCKVQEGKDIRYAREVWINGPSKLIYQPDNPLKCGAKLWIETLSHVTLFGEMSWEQMKALQSASHDGTDETLND